MKEHLLPNRTSQPSTAPVSPRLDGAAQSPSGANAVLDATNRTRPAQIANVQPGIGSQKRPGFDVAPVSPTPATAVSAHIGRPPESYTMATPSSSDSSPSSGDRPPVGFSPTVPIERTSLAGTDAPPPPPPPRLPPREWGNSESDDHARQITQAINTGLERTIPPTLWRKVQPVRVNTNNPTSLNDVASVARYTRDATDSPGNVLFVVQARAEVVEGRVRLVPISRPGELKDTKTSSHTDAPAQSGEQPEPAQLRHEEPLPPPIDIGRAKRGDAPVLPGTEGVFLVRTDPTTLSTKRDPDTGNVVFDWQSVVMTGKLLPIAFTTPEGELRSQQEISTDVTELRGRIAALTSRHRPGRDYTLQRVEQLFGSLARPELRPETVTEIENNLGVLPAHVTRALASRVNPLFVDIISNTMERNLGNGASLGFLRDVVEAQTVQEFAPTRDMLERSTALLKRAVARLSESEDPLARTALFNLAGDEMQAYQNRWPDFPDRISATIDALHTTMTQHSQIIERLPEGQRKEYAARLALWQRDLDATLNNPYEHMRVPTDTLAKVQELSQRMKPETISKPAALVGMNIMRVSKDTPSQQAHLREARSGDYQRRLNLSPFGGVDFLEKAGRQVEAGMFEHARETLLTEIIREQIHVGFHNGPSETPIRGARVDAEGETILLSKNFWELHSTLQVAELMHKYMSIMAQRAGQREALLPEIWEMDLALLQSVRLGITYRIRESYSPIMNPIETIDSIEASVRQKINTLRNRSENQ